MITTILICASIIVRDGDSISCDGQLMRLLGGGIVNERGIDTPEIGSHAKCIKERKLALIAKHRLRDLLKGERVRVEVKGSDSFGRPLVNLYLSGNREAGRVLLREGLAREWRAGRKNDWCRD